MPAIGPGAGTGGREITAAKRLGGVSYLTDCLIVSTFDHPPNVAWIERGIYSGIGILFTVGCFVAPIIMTVSERIDSQPRR
jgi:hypothetical protein